MSGAMLICVLVGTAMPVSAALDLEEWQWEAPMIVPKGTPGGFVRVMVKPAIFDQSMASLNDLRVLDEKGEVVPHVLRWGRVKEEEREEWRAAELLNRTFKPEVYSRVTLDFGERIGKNLLKVNLSGRDYRRRAMVEGSGDGERWDVLLEDGWLVDVSQSDRDIKVDTLDIPDNDFRYLRLTVFNSEEDKRRIEISAVKTALRRIVGEPELAEVPVKQVSVARDDEKKETVHELDLGFRNLPVTSLELKIDDPYFHRGYEILGRNAPRESVERRTETGPEVAEQEAPWRSVRHGVVYRIHREDKVSELVRAENLRTRYRYVQIRFFDRDNPPLKIDTEGTTVLRREASLVFDYSPERSYRLVGGNPKARQPDYDLAQAVEGVAELDLPVVAADAPKMFPREPEMPPWTERHGVLIWLALIIAVGAMVALILGNLGKLRDVGSSEDSKSED